MPLGSSDIHFLYSGNGTASGSLGGSITSGIVTTLFEDLDDEQSRSGYVDYRCIYIKNYGIDDYRNLTLWMNDENPGGSNIDIGINVANEAQTISFSGYPAAGGHLVLTVPNFPPNIMIGFDTDHPDVNLWAANFQRILRGNDGLRSCTVAGFGDPDTGVTFLITYLGDAGSRSIGNLVISDMLGGSVSGFTFTRKTQGSPVNVTAPIINQETVMPAGINFDYPLVGNPKVLGSLFDQDYFPVWVRRTTPRNTNVYREDFFTIRLDGVSP